MEKQNSLYIKFLLTSHQKHVKEKGSPFGLLRSQVKQKHLPMDLNRGLSVNYAWRVLTIVFLGRC